MRGLLSARSSRFDRRSARHTPRRLVDVRGSSHLARHHGVHGVFPGGHSILARRASTGTKSRRAMRCNASAVSDAAAATAELGYPFVKIVGQEELKLALTLNVVVRVPVVFTGAARPTSRVRERAGSRFRTRERVVVIPTPAPRRGGDHLPPRAATDGTLVTLTSVFLLLQCFPPERRAEQDSKIGGCLIMGDRGTGKSVAVRALQDLLPRSRW